MAGEEEKQEGKGFTVQDRRRFSPETGEDVKFLEEAKGSTMPGGGQSVGEFAKQKPIQVMNPFLNSELRLLPSLVSTQALMHFGKVPNPLKWKKRNRYSSGQTDDRYPRRVGRKDPQ